MGYAEIILADSDTDVLGFASSSDWTPIFRCAERTLGRANSFGNVPQIQEVLFLIIKLPTGLAWRESSDKEI